MGGPVNKQSEPIESAAQARALVEKDLEIAQLRKELVELSKAAWRKLHYNYLDWAYAGGTNECRHGIAAGFHCERCDILLIDAAYSKIHRVSVPLNAQPSTQPSTPTTS